MNLNSFQIRKICNIYALTGVWIECININRSGWASADKLSKISQWEDWSCGAQTKREAPTWKWTVSMCVNTFFPKWYLILGATLESSSTMHPYLTLAHYVTLWICTPGPSLEIWRQSTQVEESQNMPDIVVQRVISATLVVEIKRIVGWGQPKGKS
jgi:hypothetical protein